MLLRSKALSSVYLRDTAAGLREAETADSSWSVKGFRIKRMNETESDSVMELAAALSGDRERKQKTR